jgi:hypothetical protein
MAYTPKSRSEGAEAGGSHTNGEVAPRRPVEDVVRFARGLPRMARQNMSDHPEATIAAVAGGSFLLGVLLGSRVVRGVLAAAAPYAVLRVVKGELGDQLGTFVDQLLRAVSEEVKGR